MWNSTKLKEFKEDVRTELEKKWSRLSRRAADLMKMSKSENFEMTVGGTVFKSKDIVNEWMSRKSSIEELRRFIFSFDDKNETQRHFAQELIRDYVDYTINQTNSKPQRIYDSFGSFEGKYSFDLSEFSNESYSFLNALYACFPDVVVENKGLMTGRWRDDAFKGENLSQTIIAQLAGYQSYFIGKYHGLNSKEASDAFSSQFKESFGMGIDEIADRIGDLTPDGIKEVADYFRSSSKKSASQEYSVHQMMKFGFSENPSIIKMLSKTGVLLDSAFLKDIYHERFGKGDRAMVSKRYLEHDIVKLEKFGNYFNAIDLTEAHMDIVKLRAVGDQDAAIKLFVSGFLEEDQVLLRKTFDLDISVIQSKKGRRSALESELGL